MRYYVEIPSDKVKVFENREDTIFRNRIITLITKELRSTMEIDRKQIIVLDIGENNE